MMKKILILGGTRQVGRRFVEILLKEHPSEFHITFFNRNQTNSHLFPSVPRIIGNRETDDINQITRQDWDVIVDCTCYSPSSLGRITNRIKGRVGRYILISTISVYDIDRNKSKKERINEEFPLKDFTKEQINSPGLRNYGEKKVASEKILIDSQIDDFIILRPYYLFGHYDWQNLDYYWIDRIRKYDRILVPDSNKDKLNRTFLDDFVRIIIKLLSLRKHRNIYNIVTHEPKNILEHIVEYQKSLGRQVECVPVQVKELLSENIKPVHDIPLWNNGGHFIFDNKRIKNDTNFIFTSFADSLKITTELPVKKSLWMNNRLGLSREYEEKIIQKYYGKLL